jgi:hypothetical protein
MALIPVPGDLPLEPAPGVLSASEHKHPWISIDIQGCFFLTALLDKRLIFANTKIQPDLFGITRPASGEPGRAGIGQN